VRTRGGQAVLPSSLIIVAFWVLVIVSAPIRAEDSAMSRRNSARSSKREKVTLNHPIFSRWPAQYPDRLQLFSAPTPNGVKVGIMLEETSLAYKQHRIDTMADESHDSAFALNPNGKIPAIYYPDGPSGRPLALFESGAILLYLADKTGQFISADPNTRYETIQEVMWQMGGVGPMFGQVDFSTNSPATSMRTSARATVTQSNQRGCSVSSTDGSRAATG
jgi:hypothetical protein